MKDVKFKTGVITRPMGSAKNDEARVYPFVQFPELYAVIQGQRTLKEQLEKTFDQVIPWVFFRVTKRQVVPLRSYKTAWKLATERAGLPGRWVHDFRRCGARALRDAAVPESVAMRLLGQKTPSMFRRYQITNDDDKKLGIEKLAAYHAQQAKLRDTVRDKTPIPFPKTGVAHG